MAFADEIDRSDSHRYALVRLRPARYVSESLSLSGGVYQMTFPYPVARVERNGTALTEDATTPSTNDHWYYDETTQTLKVKLASAPDSSTNIVCAFYYLFYTSKAEGAEAYETPTDSATTVRPWEPRLRAEPEITQAMLLEMS